MNCFKTNPWLRKHFFLWDYLDGNALLYICQPTVTSGTQRSCVAESRSSTLGVDRPPDRSGLIIVLDWHEEEEQLFDTTGFLFESTNTDDEIRP
jgi:hypothetical protein